MSTAIVRQQDPTNVFIANIKERWNLCKVLVNSGMIPQKSPEAAMAVALKGHEIGIPMMMAFANIHFFDGKLVISADLMCAVASQRHGVKWKVERSTTEEAVVTFLRPGWDPYRVSFSIAEARQAGLLNKNNWKNYPKAMLMARAKSMGVRGICPEAFAGVYDPEELGMEVEVSASGEVLIEGGDDYPTQPMVEEEVAELERVTVSVAPDGVIEMSPVVEETEKRGRRKAAPDPEADRYAFPEADDLPFS